MGGFRFLDGISEVKKNESLTAFYRLKEDEEFLRDHFKGFPIMPGVLLIETLKQAAAQLLAVSTDFRFTSYRLKAADDVKFGQFVKPGSLLRVTARLTGSAEKKAEVDGRIELEDGPERPRRALSAHLVLESPESQAIESENARRRFEALLKAPAA